MKFRIISGIDGMPFCNCNLFEWLFENFKIDEKEVLTRSSFEILYYINIRSTKEFEKLLNKINISIEKFDNGFYQEHVIIINDIFVESTIDFDLGEMYGCELCK